MKNEWELRPLAECAKWYSGGTPSTSNPDYWGGEIPWISAGSLTSFYLRASDRRLTPLGAKSGTRLVPEGTVIFVVRGMSLKTEFRLGIARREVAFGQDCKALIAVEDIDKEFLAYAIAGRAQHILGLVDEAGHGTGRLATDLLEQLEIAVPPLVEQKRIASVLRAFDEKIEHNFTLRRTLIRGADALLSAATADTRTCRPVSEVVTFHNKERVPLSAREREERPGPYRYYGASGVFGSVDDFLFDGVYLLCGEDGTVVTDDGRPFTQYVWGRFWVNNHAHTMQGARISTELAYLALSRSDISHAVTGAVQPKLSMGNLKQVVLVLPTTENVPRLEKQIGPLFALYRSVAEETEVLRNARDYLLPRLVKGELRTVAGRPQSGATAAPVEAA